MNIKRTTCSYCSVGCSLDIGKGEDGKWSLKPTKEYSVNQGFCCPKGFHLLTPFESPERGTQPLLRMEDGMRCATSWEEANQHFTRRFKAIIEKYGRESVAFLSTGQIPFEEMALLGSVAKFGMGFIHGDGNTRQCMATAAVSYKQAFGFDAPPFAYEDLEVSDTLIFIGANPVINHPILWNRVKKNTNATIIVVDPRVTETAKEATLHLPIRPRQDLLFLQAVSRVVLDNGWAKEDYIAAHTEGFEEYRAYLKTLDLNAAAEACGVGVDAIHDLAGRIHNSPAASFWWTMGVNQGHQATRTAQAIINLALTTGHIGRPGTGPNSLTGQANAMGSRLFSNTSNMLGGRDFTSASDRQEIANILGIPESVIPQQNSLPYHKILDKIKSGEIKGLWIIATNPGHSWINKTDFHQAMKNLEFLAVQELYPDTETSQLADLYLPSAASAEKTGTFINSERRLGVVQKVKDPPGEAKSDFDICLGLAKAWGCGDLFREWTDTEATFKILQRVSKGRPCDISGIKGREHLLEAGGIQWPFPEGAAEIPEQRATYRRLFADGQFYTPSRKAKILFEPPAELPEAVNDEFPFVLVTGRGSVMQFHTQTRTGKVPFIRSKTRQKGYAEIHPEDARRLGLSQDSRVKIASRRGEVEVDVVYQDGLQPGHIFMPMHYPETNWLTLPVFDTYSFEPGYKFAAVKLSAVRQTEDAYASVD